MNNNMENLTYTHEFEELLKAESEKAEAMSVMHQMSHQYFSRLSMFVNVPVIVLSSFGGFLNALDAFKNANIYLGVLSVLVAIIKTLDSYFDWTKKSEGHRIVGLAYAKVAKLIQIQLALERECRIRARDLYDVITNDIQNLRDQEHCIVDGIIAKFQSKYGDEPTAKPTIANGLTRIVINSPQPAPVQTPTTVPLSNIETA